MVRIQRAKLVGMTALFSLANIGFGLAAVSSIVTIVWIIARLPNHKPRDLIIEGTLAVIALIGAGVNRYATYVSDLENAKTKAALGQAQMHIKADERRISSEEQKQIIADRRVAMAAKEANDAILRAVAAERRSRTIARQATIAEDRARDAMSKTRAAALEMRNAEQRAASAQHEVVQAGRAASAARKQIAALSAEVSPRHLTAAQQRAIASVLHGSGTAVAVWRCVSLETAYSLMNDFIAAFEAAGLKIENGGVSTDCRTGILVTLNPQDAGTFRLLNAAFHASDIHIYGALDRNVPIGHFTLLIGTKTTTSP